MEPLNFPAVIDAPRHIELIWQKIWPVIDEHLNYKEVTILARASSSLKGRSSENAKVSVLSLTNQRTSPSHTSCRIVVHGCANFLTLQVRNLTQRISDFRQVYVTREIFIIEEVATQGYEALQVPQDIGLLDSFARHAVGHGPKVEKLTNCKDIDLPEVVKEFVGAISLITCLRRLEIRLYVSVGQTAVEEIGKLLGQNASLQEIVVRFAGDSNQVTRIASLQVRKNGPWQSITLPSILDPIKKDVVLRRSSPPLGSTEDIKQIFRRLETSLPRALSELERRVDGAIGDSDELANLRLLATKAMEFEAQLTDATRGADQCDDGDSELEELDRELESIFSSSGTAADVLAELVKAFGAM